MPAASRVPAWLAPVTRAAQHAMEVAAIPGMVIAVARGDSVTERLAVGADADGSPLAEDSLFPVASITKMAVALAVLRMAATSQLRLDDPLRRHLPDAAAAVDGVTIRRMLSHTDGLPYDLAPGTAPYRPGLDWPALARACLTMAPSRETGQQVRYGNVGAGLLAVVVERLARQPFPEALRHLVLEPLGIEAYLGAEPPRAPARVAGRLGDHAGTDLEPFNSPFWRSLALPWGGLLTTADGALGLARAFAGEPTGFLPGDLLAEATRDQTGGLPGKIPGFGEWPRCPWGLGVEIRGSKNPHWTPIQASEASFGHAGASGCVVWADPEADVAWAILGTRTFDATWQQFAPIGLAILDAMRRR